MPLHPPPPGYTLKLLVDKYWYQIFISITNIVISAVLGLIKQFLRDVDWGDVDFLVVDTPPGTSDEHLSIVQYLSNTYVDGAIIITTPQART